LLARRVDIRDLEEIAGKMINSSGMKWTKLVEKPVHTVTGRNSWKEIPGAENRKIRERKQENGKETKIM
jgi:hypothetical protein